jgi:hypothetical protein
LEEDLVGKDLYDSYATLETQTAVQPGLLDFPGGFFVV